MGKLRALIDRTKAGAEFLKQKSNFGEYSYEKLWNVEICAEIWAVRNAIMRGIKIENMVLKTVEFDTLEDAPPYQNCKVTFKEFLDSGRLL